MIFIYMYVYKHKGVEGTLGINYSSGATPPLNPFIWSTTLELYFVYLLLLHKHLNKTNIMFL